MIARPSSSRLSRLASQSLCSNHLNFYSITRPTTPRTSTYIHRGFSSRSSLRDGLKSVNHYEVLGVSPNVTKAELKKQFYRLSKETHPDLHKNDPTASEKFSQISESYSILSNEEKRRRYDRDFVRQNPSPSGGQPGTYAGSRPASGLSKRRGTFRGAPQSFYTQGGYGNSGRSAQNSQQTASKAGTFNAAAFTERGRYDPEFDPDPIFKTQMTEDVKRSRRMQAAIDIATAERDRNDSFWIRFIIVTTIVVAGVTIGSVLVSMKNAPRGGLNRSDGSRRDGPRNEWAKG